MNAVVGAVSNKNSSNSINNNTISSKKVGVATVPSPLLLLSLCSLPVSLCSKLSCFSLNLLLICAALYLYFATGGEAEWTSPCLVSATDGEGDDS